MKPVLIKTRLASVEDAADLSKVHRASWLNAYSGILNGPALREAIAKRNPAWWRSAVEKLNAEPVAIGQFYGGRRETASRSQLLVLEYEKRIVGYANFGGSRRNYPPQIAERWGEIYELYLLPEFQGVGLGKILFNGTRSYLKKMGYTALVVWALEANDHGKEFYEAMGGEPFVRSHEIFGGSQAPTIGYRWV
ncbi:MAG: GNAT family N-acetyltransferase [Hyphomicrobiales bacterium]|uniref:GNAT family N-acetyltransferase n=1 Tax=Nisaea sp. TaxID=2024842 RepID=UPI003279D45C